MNREQCKALLPVLGAFIDGKPIQYRCHNKPNAVWRDNTGDCPDFNSLLLWRVKPEKKRVWLNIYPGGNAPLHRSRMEADSSAMANRIACIQIEYCEGQGLD